MEPIKATGWKQPPKCAIEGCNNSALCLVGGKLLCGSCTVKFNAVQNKMIFEQMGKGAV